MITAIIKPFSPIYEKYEHKHLKAYSNTLIQIQLKGYQNILLILSTWLLRK